MKKLFISMLCLGLYSSLSAKDYSAELTVSSIETEGGSSYVAIDFTNDEPVTAIEFCIVMPEGVQFKAANLYYNGRGYKSGGRNPQQIWKTSYDEKPGYIWVSGYTDTEDLEAGKGSMFEIEVQATDGVVVTADMFRLCNVESSAHGTILPTRYLAGNLGKKGYSSFSSTKPMLIESPIESPITAYYASLDGELVVLEPAADNTAKEESGLILKGNEGDPIYAVSITEGPAAFEENKLIGCARGKVVAENEVYVLSTENNVAGFYQYAGTWIPAGKAFLDYSSSNGAPLRVVIADETGIHEVAAEDLEGVIFNLNGQKVNEAKKGVYIVNGKKVMF